MNTGARKRRARRPRARKAAELALADVEASDRLLFVLERLADGVERIAERLDSWNGADNDGENWLDVGATVNGDDDDGS